MTIGASTELLEDVVSSPVAWVIAAVISAAGLYGISQGIASERSSGGKHKRRQRKFLHSSWWPWNA
ncbi:hypothetical protein KGO06_01280 [Patescibacteria group bacterium]|nr:hypothetical protein [Patescibacteria group bacterium]